MNIIKARVKPRIFVMLRSLKQTDKAWIFRFGDPYNRFDLTMILPKDADWEAAEYMWELVHEKFLEAARKKQWLQ